MGSAHADFSFYDKYDGMTLYVLKLRFQALLRPVAGRMARAGITANQVTLVSAAVSVAIGLGIAASAAVRLLFLLIPMWLVLRMGLNAIDGMLAREFRQQSKLGAYLNELGDVVSDAALYAPFAFVPPFSVLSVGAVIFLSLLVEFAGVLGVTAGGERRYDGPMGKSDRALVFGALGLWIGIEHVLPPWALWTVPILLALLGATLVNRVRRAIRSSDVSSAVSDRRTSRSLRRGLS